MDKIKFAMLVQWINTCLRTKDYFELSELSQLEEMIKDAQEPTKIDLGNLVGLLNAMRYGRKIDAIKYHRALTGYTLKDSKDFIEANWITKPTLNEFDELYKLLQDGKANADDQHSAAEWIKRLHQ